MAERGVRLPWAAPLSRLPLLFRHLLAALAGGVTALGQAPFDLPALAVLGLFAALVLWLAAPTVRSASVTGWVFGTTYFAVALSWIVEPFLVDIARHGWMAPFALTFMAGGLALFWGTAFGLGFLAAPPAWRPVVWAVCLTLAELARSYVLTGFPWALIGHIWIDTGAAQWAAAVGPVGLTGLTLLIIGGTVVVAQRAGLLYLALAPALFGALVVTGNLRIPDTSDPPTGAPVVRIIQPNAPQHQKWDPDHIATFFRRQIGFTEAAASGPEPELVIWPETAIPWMLHRAAPAFEEIARAAKGTPVVLGLQRREAGLAFNAAAVLGPDGAPVQVYDKHHLVPFGEYIPLGGLTELLGLRSFAAQDGYGYSPGRGAALLDFGPLGRALPLICYEAIFPQDLHAAPDRPDWLLQLTNDAWFGQFSGPYQHLAQARLRAIEHGLPMIRSANTGVSAVIDPWGRVLAELPLGQAGFIDHALPTALPPTLYARTGDRPIALLFIVAALVLAAGRVLISD